MELLNNAYLIKTIEELTAYVSNLAISDDIDAFKPDILDVQFQYIKPVLGDYYAELVELYNAEEEMADEEKQLLYFVQKAIANLALAQFVPLANVKLGQNGITEPEDANFKAAKQWRVDDLRGFLYKRGYRAIDEVLNYLEENSEDFETWASDEKAYTVNKKFIVPDAKTFQEWHDIQSSRKTFVSLFPIMKSIEQYRIRPTLSTALFTRIKAEIKSGEISEDIEEILPDLQACLVKYTILKACELQLIQVNDSEIFIRALSSGDGNNRQRSKPDQIALKVLSDACYADGQLALQTVIDHLNANASADKFPEWFSSGLYKSPEKSSKAYLSEPDDKIYFA